MPSIVANWNVAKSRKKFLSEEKLFHSLWEKQLAELKKALDNPAGDKKSHSYLGADFNRGDNSIVELYVDAIEAKAKDPYDIMLLMGAVLLHEYFHSFHFHAGTGASDPPKCIEESMADYGSLVMLDRVTSSGLPIAKDAEIALKYALVLSRANSSVRGISTTMDSAPAFTRITWKKLPI